jgi:hypothetical protein
MRRCRNRFGCIDCGVNTDTIGEYYMLRPSQHTTSRTRTHMHTPIGLGCAVHAMWLSHAFAHVALVQHCADVCRPQKG